MKFLPICKREKICNLTTGIIKGCHSNTIYMFPHFWNKVPPLLLKVWYYTLHLLGAAPLQWLSRLIARKMDGCAMANSESEGFGLGTMCRNDGESHVASSISWLAYSHQPHKNCSGLVTSHSYTNITPSALEVYYAWSHQYEKRNERFIQIIAFRL